MSGTDGAGQPVLTAQNGLRVVVEGVDGESGIVAVMAGEVCPS